MAGENTQVDEPNWLDMSDEELLKAPMPDFSAVADEVKPEAKEEAADPVVKAEAEDEEDTEDKDDKEPAGEAKPGDEESEDEADPKKGEAKDPKAEAKEAKPEAKKDDKSEKKEADAAAIDYAAAGKELLAPFKANGREIRVDSVEDARTLMQMGANYNKKMAALKPNLKLMKMLENNGLLSEEKLSFLIDVAKKDSGAINKLVKDSGLNPMDLDAEKAGEYKPKTHAVDDREVDLDNVLDDLQGSDSYARTLDIVAKWDGPSKQAVAKHPELVKVMHDHVERGIYDLISAEIERERTFGRVPESMSFIEAYRQVGDAIQARGGFNHLGSSQGKTSAEKVVVTPKPKSGADDKRDEKRRALSSPKPASSSNDDSSLNPLDMDDAEFEKMAKKRFR